ncbi:hypothetical protein BDR26DRAFT_872877 [Obelidium mucronatum]|nr:hypothetical protein BDR26DRAFT_872877 [Obelidium mucronatum]
MDNRKSSIDFQHLLPVSPSPVQIHVPVSAIPVYRSSHSRRRRSVQQQSSFTSTTPEILVRLPSWNHPSIPPIVMVSPQVIASACENTAKQPPPSKRRHRISSSPPSTLALSSWEPFTECENENAISYHSNNWTQAPNFYASTQHQRTTSLPSPPASTDIYPVTADSFQRGTKRARDADEAILDFLFDDSISALSATTNPSLAPITKKLYSQMRQTLNGAF